MGFEPTRPFERRDDDSLRTEPRVASELAQADPPPGSRIGRYLVEDVIGRGGMGIVVRAHDPTLDRPVAIKLVRGRPDPQRLLREARALARLDHESIIEVFDAGVHEGGVFIAMEYFEGASMDRWLRAQQPGLDERVELFLRLADALRSAHAHGLVHRDVKPQNVLLDPSDRSIRVVDFGLARSFDSFVPGEEDVSSSGHRESTLGAVSRADVVVGTPPYMAPEVLDGARPSREADTWALGVTLYEALHGRRPFAGSKLAELRLQMRRPPAISADVPRPLRRVLRGMLDLDVGKRWTLERVHRALWRYHHRKRRRRLGLAVGSLVVASVAVGAFMSRTPGCSPDTEAAGAIYDHTARTQIEAAFERAAPYGNETWERLAPVVDARFDDWIETRRQVCGELPGTEDPAIRQQVLGCLDRHLGALEAAVYTLRQPTPALIARVDDLVERLPRPHQCGDPAARERLAPVADDKGRRETAARIRAALTKLALTRIAGRLDEARRLADALDGQARELDDPPTSADVALERGRVLAELGHHEAAEQSFRAALRLGLRPDYLQVRAEAALSLAEELGHGQKRFEAAREALRSAEALVVALDEPAAASGLRLTSARLALAAEDFAEAQATYEELLRDPEAIVSRGDLLHGLASALIVDDRARAAELLEEALRLRAAEYGPSHPKVADTLATLGRIKLHEGEPKVAAVHLRRARTIRVARFGESSSAVAEIDVGLGGAALRSEQLDVAQQHLESALATLDADPDGVDFDTAATRSTLGIVYARQGRFEDALREHKAAMELVAASVGPKHRRMALPLLNIASTYRRMGRLQSAIEWQRKAIDANAIEDQRAELMIELAEMLRLTDAAAEARQLLRQVCASKAPRRVCALAEVGLADLDLDAGEIPTLGDPSLVEDAYAHSPSQIARLRLCQARIAWASGERDRARQYGEAALDGYAAGVRVEDFDQQRVETWLQTHPSN